MSEVGHNADRQLRSLVERILNLKAEQDDLAADIRDIYAEAKGNGYDKTALGALVSEIRKRSKDAAKFDEGQSILDLYREAFERASHTHAPARAPIPHSSLPSSQATDKPAAEPPPSAAGTLSQVQP